jgi:tetratricopeptide (TPR) repeat protein
MKKLIYALCLAAFCFAGAQNTSAQALNLPRESQAASVTQRIGITDISVAYSSPAVRGRKIWDSLVPYNKIWRAGANENTVITFTDDVSIEGKPLAAGTYGLHMIPTAGEWTVIFSKNHTSWGSFFYKKDEDALRVQVKPEAHPFQEYLSYGFSDRKDESAVLELDWEKLKVPVKVSVDVNAVVLNNIRNQLRSTAAFTWEGWNEAANYCLEKKINTDEALKWAEASIRSQKNFFNLRTKSALLAQKGDTKGSEEAMQQALAFADANQLNAYGYQLLAQGKTDEAIEIFKKNVKNNPDDWNGYDSLAEAYGMKGDKKQAISNYKAAYKKAPEDQKTRISSTVQGLGGSI